MRRKATIGFSFASKSKVISSEWPLLSLQAPNKACFFFIVEAIADELRTNCGPKEPINLHQASGELHLSLHHRNQPACSSLASSRLSSLVSCAPDMPQICFNQFGHNPGILTVKGIRQRSRRWMRCYGNTRTLILKTLGWVFDQE